MQNTIRVCVCVWALAAMILLLSQICSVVSVPTNIFEKRRAFKSQFLSISRISSGFLCLKISRKENFSVTWGSLKETVLDRAAV